MEVNTRIPGRLVHYVPGEICVVTGAVHTGDPARWYEEVRRQLNVRLAEFLPKAPIEGPTCLEQDLLASELKRWFSGNPQVLQPLSRQDSRVHPWVSLPRSGAPSTDLLFYQVGRATEDLTALVELVRQLVNVLNTEFLGPLASEGSRNGRLLAATPNWLSAGTAAEFTEGGPGARPEPAPRGGWTFRFGDADLNRQVTAARDRAKSSSVVVAVLDTSPPARQVQAKAASPDANYLLRRAASELQFDASFSLASSYFGHLTGYMVNWNRSPTDEPEYLTRYPMPDHGLFAAGIICDIAPAATIHLVRVLNDWGVGDLLALALTLSRLPGELLTDDQQRLVINLSLVLDLPPLEQLRRFWWPKASRDETLTDEGKATIDRTLNIIHSSLAQVIAWLAGLRTLVVSAAGNDANLASPRPEPRLPARYDSGGIARNVLGVAAVTRNHQPSNFSNRGDEAAGDTGVATFGGNATRVPAGPSQIDVSGTPVDAVVGIFSSDTLPLSGTPNTTGWAYWAGTSFATPVISAIAAMLWLSNPSRSAEEIIKLVRDFATGPGGGLLCPTLQAYQEP